MISLSLTARISLLFAIFASLVMFVTGLLLTRVVAAHFQEGDRQELQGKLELIQNLFRNAGSAEQLELLRGELSNALIGHHGLAVVVTDSAGDVWFEKSGVDFPRAMLSVCETRPDDCRLGMLQQWKQAGVSFRGMFLPVHTDSGESFTVAVAQDIQHHVVFLEKFQQLLAMAIALASLTTAGLGWVATRWGLSPLRQVTRIVSTISAERLADRLPSAGLPTELKPLVTAFNAMLARLDDSFRRLSEFSSNIAHELRTPITSLMTQNQVALSNTRSTDEYKEILYSSLEEYERMAQMVGDMLYLAQADNGLLKPGLEKVDLADETQELFDYFEAWAEERGVSLTKAGNAVVPGDRLMLRRALSNLLANAIRHTPQGRTVHVSLNSHDSRATVSVENPGPEIPPEHLPRLFDRFYRADPSRQRKGDGAGLGLAIVKSIADIHGGAISARSANGTTQFQLVLPASGNGATHC